MKKTRLLIIEDDHFLAQLANQIIAQSFNNITVTGITGSIREAEKKIASGHPDILLLDVELNDGTAFELLSRIDCNNMKIIFMSAHEEYALEAIAFSSIDFITKPFDINDLIGAIMKAQEEMNDHDTPKQIETLINNLSPQNDIRLYLKSGQNHSLSPSMSLFGRNRYPEVQSSKSTSNVTLSICHCAVTNYCWLLMHFYGAIPII